MYHPKQTVMRPIYQHPVRKFALALLLLGQTVGMGLTANAQDLVINDNDGRVKKEKREGIRMARKDNSLYKESHLDPDMYNYRDGSTRRKGIPSDSKMKFFKCKKLGVPQKKKTFGF